MKPLQTIDHRLKKYAAVLFVVLIACFGFVQAVHVHDALAKQSSPASHCSLCMIAHSAAVVTATGTSLAPIVRSALLAVSDPQLRSQLQVASSFIRPPPPVL
jgi:ABC-type amino acid transport system permease subunit